MSVEMYTSRFCPYCIRAKRFFDNRGIPYREIDVDNRAAIREEMITRSGRRTVPQIWIGDVHVGGFMDLWQMDQQNQLSTLLPGTSSD